MKQVKNKNNLKKNFIWNTIGSTVVSSTSLLFLIIVTRINGISDAGIFTFSFSMACLLQVIANFGGRSFQVTETNKSINSSDFCYTKIITCLGMIIISIIFLIINNYSVDKVLIFTLLVLFKLLESIQELFYASLQIKELLYKAGISMILKSIISVLVFLFVDIYTKNLTISCIFLLLSYIFVLLVYDIPNANKVGFKILQINWQKIWYILKNSFSIFLFTILTQYVINAQKITIDKLLDNNSQAIFGILIMPATLMLLCSQFIIQPYLTTFKNLISTEKINILNKTVIKMNLALILFGIACIAIAYFIGIPIINFIFNIEIDHQLNNLIFILTGSIFFGLSIIFSNVLIAMRKNTYQLIIYIFISIFTLILSYFLVASYELNGAVISYMTTMFMLIILYIVYYIYCVYKWKKDQDGKNINNNTSI